jgi:ABC-type transport system substrate-binding protein
LVKLTQAAKVETNDAKRIEILKKIQEISSMEGPWVVLLQLPRYYATRANIGNAYYTPYLLELDQITKD